MTSSAFLSASLAPAPAARFAASVASSVVGVNVSENSSAEGFDDETQSVASSRSSSSKSYCLGAGVELLTALLDTLHNLLADGLVHVLEGVLCGFDGALLDAHRGAEEADVAGELLTEHGGGELLKFRRGVVKGFGLVRVWCLMEVLVVGYSGLVQRCRRTGVAVDVVQV